MSFIFKLLSCIPLASLLTIKKSLDKFGEPPVGEDGEIKGKDSDSVVSAFKIGYFALVILLMIASAAASILATFSVDIIVDVACYFLIGMAVLISGQRYKLRLLGSFRTLVNELRADVNRFSAENDKLTSNVDRLQTENKELGHVATEFEAMAASMGSDVDRLDGILLETRGLQEEMKQQIARKVQQEIIDIVLRADTNEDFKVSGKREFNQLCNRLRSVEGVEFDRANFVRITNVNEKDPEVSLNDIFTLFHTMKNQKVPESQRAFHYKPRQLVEKECKKKRDSGVYQQRRQSRATMMKKQNTQTATLEVLRDLAAVTGEEIV